MVGRLVSCVQTSVGERVLAGVGGVAFRASRVVPAFFFFVCFLQATARTVLLAGNLRGNPGLLLVRSSTVCDVVAHAIVVVVMW